MLEWHRVWWRIRPLSNASALRRQQYAPPPILCLPLELIIKIIQDATDFSDHWMARSDHYYRKLHSLAQVCRFFADIIKVTPILWSTLDSRAALTSFPWNAVIRRSQSCPLFVRHNSLVSSADSTF
ncbi:hypothetical protein FRB94_009465 [Tulasnella sp. JGI-2019a]|nr:hypothetical protein FRB94_009465 [Tulasnella sp. JGI-2019a]